MNAGITCIAMLALAVRVDAQGPPPGTRPGEPLTNAAVAESLKVLTTVERTLGSRSRDAAAWHRRGMVAWALAYRGRIGPPHDGVDWTLLGRAADSSLRIALQLRGDDPQIMLHTAQFLLASGQTAMRAQSYRLFSRALELARKQKNPALLTEALIEEGRVYWRRYDAVANRRIEPEPGFARSLTQYAEAGRPFGGDGMTTGAGMTGGQTYAIPVKQVADRLNNSTQPLPPDAVGAVDYERAEALFREALEIAPESTRAFRQLAMVLAEKRRWPELSRLARDRARRLPADADAPLILGLSLHRQRQASAVAAFETGLAALPAGERAYLSSMRRVVPTQDLATFDARSASERARDEVTYWRFADPLWSRGGSDARTEFLARAVFADLRWTVEELGVRGIDSDRGEIHVRYGPPDLEAVLGPAPARGDLGPVFDVDYNTAMANQVTSRFDVPPPVAQHEIQEITSLTTLWAYNEGWLIMFHGAPTYATARIPPEDVTLVDSLVRATPASWRNAAEETIGDMATQVARFRGAADSVDIVVASDPPVAEIQAATVANALVRTDFWLFGQDNPTSLHDSASVQRAGTRAWTTRVAAGTYAYRVEATSDGALLAGRSTDWVVATADPSTGFATRGFGISDVLLVGNATPRAGARRWFDIDVDPTAGTVPFGGQLAIVWENYDLTNTDGSANYAVRVAVERRYKQTINRIRARVIGVFAAMAGVERTADRVIFNWDRSAPHAETVLDHLTIGLDDTPPGEYRLTITITDSATGRTGERVQRFFIRE